MTNYEDAVDRDIKAALNRRTMHKEDVEHHTLKHHKGRDETVIRGDANIGHLRAPNIWGDGEEY